MLMGDYGWPSRRYEAWLARMILSTVVSEDSSPAQETNKPLPFDP
jgi:hypothetical protein